MDAKCPRCAQTIRLPGKLSSLATIRTARQKEPLGLALEIGGFIAMFFFFPWGILLGLILVFLGWRKSNRLVCSNCGTILKSRTAETCPACRSKFSSE